MTNLSELSTEIFAVWLDEVLSLVKSLAAPAKVGFDSDNNAVTINTENFDSIIQDLRSGLLKV